MTATLSRLQKTALVLIAVAILAVAAGACSPGTLPGAPSPILTGGGAGRYNGTFITRRTAGNYTVTEVAQSLTLSMVLREGAQLAGQFDAGESSGTLQGVLSGSLVSGTFQATVLIGTTARQGVATSTCEGRGEVTGTLSGVNLSWTGGTITYGNCPGLSVTSQAQAIAVSPIPAPAGNRASVVMTIAGGTTVARATCSDGTPGYPFTVEMTESTGISVTFDSTFVVEERRGFGAASLTTLDMPFPELAGGTRRTYGACSPVAGTYQAFFSGIDANGNRVRVATPIVVMGP